MPKNIVLGVNHSNRPLRQAASQWLETTTSSIASPWKILYWASGRFVVELRDSHSTWTPTAHVRQSRTQLIVSIDFAHQWLWSSPLRINMLSLPICRYCTIAQCTYTVQAAIFSVLSQSPDSWDEILSQCSTRNHAHYKRILYLFSNAPHCHLMASVLFFSLAEQSFIAFQELLVKLYEVSSSCCAVTLVNLHKALDLGLNSVNGLAAPNWVVMSNILWALSMLYAMVSRSTPLGVQKCCALMCVDLV